MVVLRKILLFTKYFLSGFCFNLFCFVKRKRGTVIWLFYEKCSQKASYGRRVSFNLQCNPNGS